MRVAARVILRVTNVSPRRGTYSIAKARERLGWEPRMALEDGMERMLAWLREHHA